MTVRPPGQLSDTDQACLTALAGSLGRSSVVVEVGALYGLSAYTFAAALSNDATIYSIDTYNDMDWMRKVSKKELTISQYLKKYIL